MKLKKAFLKALNNNLVGQPLALQRLMDNNIPEDMANIH
jgi:hypothetical protein